MARIARFALVRALDRARDQQKPRFLLAVR